MKRRHFIGLSSSLLTTQLLAKEHTPKQQMCIFTKGLQSLSYEALAKKVAGAGVTGIEATIRQGGHIEPEMVPDELPKMVAALRKQGLDITVMASSINDVSNPFTEQTLRVAAGLGIKRYRLQYFRYTTNETIASQLGEWRAKLKDLAALNNELGIQGLYQNHAGEKYFGAGIWDLAEVLDGISARGIAVAYDIRHATVEGGTSWPVAFRRIWQHVDTVYAKDFVWEGKRVKNVPLGSGRVDYPRFLSMLQAKQFRGPISIHVEYLDHRDPDLIEDHIAANSRDVSKLRTIQAGL